MSLYKNKNIDTSPFVCTFVHVVRINVDSDQSPMKYLQMWQNFVVVQNRLKAGVNLF